jgi:hypothetical protein
VDVHGQARAALVVDKGYLLAKPVETGDRLAIRNRFPAMHFGFIRVLRFTEVQNGARARRRLAEEPSHI